jgi:hypothetical protein
MPKAFGFAYRCMIEWRDRGFRPSRGALASAQRGTWARVARS